MSRDTEIAAAALLGVLRDAELRSCRNEVDLEVLVGTRRVGAGQALPSLVAGEPTASFAPRDPQALHAALLLDLDPAVQLAAVGSTSLDTSPCAALLWMKANLHGSSQEPSATLVQRWAPDADGPRTDQPVRRIVALCCKQACRLDADALGRVCSDPAALRPAELWGALDLEVVGLRCAVTGDGTGGSTGSGIGNDAGVDAAS
eukprot:6472150-Prymnesium_polylepis.1